MTPSHTPIPYMAFFEYQFSEEIFSSGGFLVLKEFVLTDRDYERAMGIKRYRGQIFHERE